MIAVQRYEDFAEYAKKNEAEDVFLVYMKILLYLCTLYEHHIYSTAYIDTADVRPGIGSPACGLSADCGSSEACGARSDWSDNTAAACGMGDYMYCSLVMGDWLL